ncbi:hypothetical protein BBJ28_00010467 [Nothophytophthora sp. Chile5]|nr:hypothetical protein BBJ28_00010467 [Nothophytophthora sp. Chile5]
MQLLGFLEGSPSSHALPQATEVHPAAAGNAVATMATVWRRLVGSDNLPVGSTARVVRRQYQSISAERSDDDEVDAVALYEVEFLQPALSETIETGQTMEPRHAPLGIELETDFYGHNAIVKRVQRGSAAATLVGSCIRTGHVVVAVNGQDLSHLEFQEVLAALKAARSPRVIRFLDPEVLPLNELRYTKTLVNRDQYGFAKDDKYILSHRKQLRKKRVTNYHNERKWAEFVQRHGGLDAIDRKLHQHVSPKDLGADEQRGMRQELRVGCSPSLWGILAHVTPYKANYPPKYFHDLIANGRWEDAGPAATLADIDLDITRTYPEHPFFQTGARGQDELRSVLCAYALHDPVIGYCQSMNFLVGILVLFMEVEDAFWLLCAMMEPRYLPAANYARSMAGTQTDQLVFRALALQELPVVVARLELCGIQIQLWTLHWFLCAFVCTLPTESALRVWDWFFWDGEEVLFTVAIGILKLAEPAVLAAKTHSELQAIMRSVGTDLHDDDKLIEALYDMSGFSVSRSREDEPDAHKNVPRTSPDELVSPSTPRRLPTKMQQLWRSLTWKQEDEHRYVKNFTLADIEKVRTQTWSIETMGFSLCFQVPNASITTQLASFLDGWVWFTQLFRCGRIFAISWSTTLSSLQ